MFNYYGFYAGSFVPKKNKVSGKLLVNQVLKSVDLNERLKIAKEIIYSASHNILRNLKYYNNRGKDMTSEIKKIETLRTKIKDSISIEQLMGYEGNVRKEYYGCWSNIVNQELDFEKRVKRPPDNVINSLISFLNSLIYTKTLGEIYKTQIDPTVSFLHQSSEKRFSLSLDISEIFKPLIVDRTIFNLLNKNIITEKDFEKGNEGLLLKEASVKKVIQSLEETLKRTIMHKKLKREVSYKYLIRLEIYKLIKHILDDEEYEGFKMWW